VGNKRIIIITYGNFPYGDASANLLRNFALALDKSGHQVEVILPNGESNSSVHQSSPGNSQKLNKLGRIKYRFLGYRFHPKNKIGKLFALFRSFFATFFFLAKNNIRRKETLIILYDISFTTALPVILSRLFKRPEAILILPEYYDHYQFPRLSKGRINWHNFHLGMLLFAKYFDGYIVLSMFLKNYVINTLQSKKPILLMPNLVDPNDFSPGTKTDFLQDKITIGYVGTPSIKDGVMDLIEAFGKVYYKHPDLHLLIIGDLPLGKSILPPLKNLSADLRILEAVTFTGLVSKNVVAELLGSCQILALTRPNSIVSEAGFPTKLGEYFSCKKPVLLTSVGDMKLYFTDNMHVKFAIPGDVASIAKGLEQLILDQNLRSVLAENGYQWMLENLSYQNQSGRLSDFLQNV
jgi:glycosyltransferase involved in cell wall biosynthesis